MMYTVLLIISGIGSFGLFLTPPRSRAETVAAVLALAPIVAMILLLVLHA